MNNSDLKAMAQKETSPDGKEWMKQMVREIADMSFQEKAEIYQILNGNS